MNSAYSSENKFHTPVLLQEVVTALEPEKGKKIIDASVGFGGHTIELAKHGAQVLGIDRDKETLEKLQVTIDESRLTNIALVHGSFADIKTIADQEGFNRNDGALFDLGFSSWQIDQSGRGFSFMKDEPLDMRFNPNDTYTTAADILNTYLKEELKTIFARYGELENADQIAETIVKHRPLWKTSDLNKVIAEGYPDQMINKLLARVYQAIRIAVNDEFTHIEEGIRGAIEILKPGGRLCVISFHSLEDRIVKREMKTVLMKRLSRKPIVASEEERKINSRSRSAKLRIGEKI